jgi:hypothetical protein
MAKNSAPKDRLIARTGHVAIPKGRQSSAVKHVKLPNDTKANNRPMKRGL